MILILNHREIKTTHIHLQYVGPTYPHTFIYTYTYTSIYYIYIYVYDIAKLNYVDKVPHIHYYDILYGHITHIYAMNIMA